MTAKLVFWVKNTSRQYVGINLKMIVLGQILF